MNNKKPILLEVDINQPIPEGYVEISESDAAVVREISAGLDKLSAMIEAQYQEYGFENKRIK